LSWPEKFCHCCVFGEDTAGAEGAFGRGGISGDAAVLAWASRGWLGKAGFPEADDMDRDFF